MKNSSYQLETDNLAVGLTKPATQFGVPLLAFYSNVMVCGLGGMFSLALSNEGFTSILFFLTLFVIVHFSMAWITFRDPFGLQIAWLNFTNFRKHMNNKLWNNTDSFSP